MPYEFVEQDGDLVVFRIWGQLTYSQWEEGQAGLEPRMQSGTVTRMLVLIQGFEGWERTERWGDLAFVSVNDDHLTHIAIVGDPEWREDMLSFSLQGMRKAAVDYFDDERAARDWLSNG